MTDARRHMEAVLATLERSLAAHGPITPYVGGDEGERAVVNVAHWLLSKGQARDIARVHALRAALERLDAGRYGTCEGCGDPINPKRLEVLPEASHCLACQETRDREATANTGRRAIEDEDDA